MTDLHIEQEGNTKICVDNQNEISIANNTVFQLPIIQFFMVKQNILR